MRATCQSISYCSPRPKASDDRVTVARPSDGPTDPSRRSRRADPAVERETNKIIKDDRRGRRAPRRQRSTVTVEGVFFRRRTSAPPRAPGLWKAINDDAVIRRWQLQCGSFCSYRGCYPMGQSRTLGVFGVGQLTRNFSYLVQFIFSVNYVNKHLLLLLLIIIIINN